jgi:YbbR domain-containing protein
MKMTFKNLTDKILENWPAKIICLTLAVLLFLFYRMSALDQRFFSVPLVIETNGDLVPASPYPRMVKIGLRGEANSINPILEEDVVAFLDLSKFNKEGEVRVPIQTRIKGTAVDVDPLEITVEPTELILRIEHRMVKKVPVTPSFKGYPEAGYEFNGYTLNTAQMEISGPRSAVDKITDIITEPIELSARNTSFDGAVLAVNKNNLVSISGQSRVDFHVTISQTTLVKNYDDVPFYYENLDPNLVVESNVVSGTIQLKGTQTDLSDWSLPDNALTVLCENITSPGVYSLPVQIIIPEPFEVLKSSPASIQLTVRRKVQ